MKIKVLFCTTVLGMLFFTAPASPVLANNLLTNENFENGLSNWTVAGPNWEAQSAVVRQGVISVKNTVGIIPGQDYFASLSQIINLTAGQAIYVTAQAKTDIDPRSSAVAGVMVEFLNAANGLVSKKQTQIGGLADWRQLYLSATAPVGTAKVKYHVFVFADDVDALAIGGKAYFDEAVLSTDPIAAPLQPTTLSNPGFENGLNDWNLIYSPSLSVDNVEKFEGNLSAKNTIATNLGFDFFSSASQDLDYVSGPVYASAQVKSNMNAASSARVGLLLEFYDRFNPSLPAHKKGEAKEELSGINDWTRLVINGATPPVGTEMIRVHVYAFALNGDASAHGATANFDDVIFSYSPLPPVFRTNLLNSNFENGLNSWSELFGFPATVSTTAHLGSFSAKKTIGQIQSQDYYSQIYQDIYYNASGDPFPDNTPVYATAYVKTAMSPLTKSKAGLQFEFIDSLGNPIEDVEGNPIVVNDAVGGNTEWRYLYVNRTTPPGTAKIRVGGFEFAREVDASLAGDAFYDDFQFSLTPLIAPNITNLINGGFENGLNDWDELNSPGEVSTTIVHSGNHAARFTVDNAVLTGDYFGSVSQDIPVNAGRGVSLSGWVRTDINPLAEATSGGLSIAFLDINGHQVGTEVVDSVSGLQDWAQIAIGAAVPSNAVKARVTCFLFASQLDGADAISSKAYFDDVIFLGSTRRKKPVYYSNP